MHPRSGPLGGLAQTGSTRIDSRLARERVLRQLAWIGMLGESGRLVVADGPSHAVADASDGMLYLDPPYVEQADRLYATSFTATDHLELCSYLSATERPWVLSYDDHPLVRSLYADHDVDAPPHTYTAGGTTVGRELIITNTTAAVAA